MFWTRRFQGPLTDHFDGRRFHNAPTVSHGGWRDFLRWRRTSTPGPWRDWTEAPPGPPPTARVAKGELRVTFVNHATVLIQMDGLNVLTDPIWSYRCSPLSFIGPRRRRPPGLRFEDLPSIDAILVSHNHYDHLDLPTLRRLQAKGTPRLYTGLGNHDFLESRGIGRSRELDWWEGVELAPGVTVHGVPAQHFSGRGLRDRDRSLWMGFVIGGPSGSVYFAGDTAFGPHFEEIRKRCGPVRLALLPIGAFQPEWFMGRVHLSPEQALEAHRVLGAGSSMAIHFGTFRLADDGEEIPAQRLRAAVLLHPDPKPNFWVPGFGESRDVPMLSAPAGI
jgi:L-ascorbate metabolism protein UlaG (beta-lactamase superfamily)